MTTREAVRNIGAQVERSGYCFPMRALDSQGAYRCRQHVEEFALGLHQDGLRRSLHVYNLHLYFTWCRDLVTSPAILDAVEDVIGPNIIIQGSTLTAKSAHCQDFVSWHQDGVFLARGSYRAVAAYVSISASTQENGCLQVVPETHHLGSNLPRTDTYEQGNLLPRGDVVQYDIDKSKVVDVLLAAGEFSLHDLDTIHGSKPNRSAHPRVGLTVRYIEPGVAALKHRPPVVVARGSDPHRCFPWAEDTPPSNFPEQLAAYRAAYPA